VWLLLCMERGVRVFSFCDKTSNARRIAIRRLCSCPFVCLLKYPLICTLLHSELNQICLDMWMTVSN
jgi:hypothetical protein